MFFAVLTERARAGVEVRVLLDGLGGMRAPQAKGSTRCERRAARSATSAPRASASSRASTSATTAARS